MPRLLQFSLQRLEREPLIGWIPIDNVSNVSRDKPQASARNLLSKSEHEYMFQY